MPHYRPPSYRLREREQVYVVYGLPFDDEATAILARKVLIISSTMSLFAFVSAILMLVTGFYWGYFIWIGLVLPCCGYFGTLSRSRFAVSFFATCAMVVGIVYVIAIVVTTATVGDWAACACDPVCRADHYISAADAAKICSAPNTFRALYWVSAAFAVVMAALLCTGSVYGFKLASMPHFEEVELPVVAVPTVTHFVVAHQPGAGSYVVPMTHGTPVYSPYPVGTTYRAYATPTAGQPQQQFTYAPPPPPQAPPAADAGGQPPQAQGPPSKQPPS